MPELFRRRTLPHWDVPGSTYFVTCCLAGSIPARGLLELRAAAARKGPQRCSETAFVRREEWLDGCRAVRWLTDTRLARIVESSLQYFAGVRYDLVAYVIMPSHFHWVFTPLISKSMAGDYRANREGIMHSIRRHTARACNRCLNRRGPFWQHESFDRVVRNEAELQRIVDYVEFNPVKAGLCEQPKTWEFSSAWRGGVKQSKEGGA